MTMPELVLITVGGVLIWAAIKNQNPIELVKQVLSGEKPK